jgi:hypothetical protein
MFYTTFDANRAAPLLVGRMRHIATPTISRRPGGGTNAFWTTMAGGGILLIMAGFWVRYFRSRKRASTIAATLPSSEIVAENWLKQLEDEATDAPPHDQPPR